MLRISPLILALVLALISGCDQSDSNNPKAPQGVTEEVSQQSGLTIKTQMKTLHDGKKIPHGTCTMFHPNGAKAGEGAYVDGKENGIWRAWREDGTLRMEGKYLFGLKEGKWTLWDDKGGIETTEWWQNGQRITSPPRDDALVPPDK